MKYMLLIHQGTTPTPLDPEAWATLSNDEQQAIYAAYQAINSLTTDGPFVDTKESINGYLIYDADDLDAAIELAARIPAARLGGAIEVRPIMEW